MKLIITAEENITLEVQPKEGQEAVAFTDIIGTLEYVKSLVTDQLKLKLLQMETEKQEQ